MAKHYVYQIPKSERELATQSVFYSLSEAFTKADAKKAFIAGKYKRVADVEALGNPEVKDLVNNDRGSTKILKLGALRNVNVGDLIYNEETKLYFIVSATGFDRLKI